MDNQNNNYYNDDEYDDYSKYCRRPAKFNDIFNDDYNSTITATKTKDTLLIDNLKLTDDSCTISSQQPISSNINYSNILVHYLREKKEIPAVTPKPVALEYPNEKPQTPQVQRVNEIARKTLEAQQNAEKLFHEEKKKGPIEIKEIIRAILNDRYFNLESCKQLSIKRQLLKEAILSNDGNIILAIVLFLKRSLNEENFYSVMQEKDFEAAVYHYVHYLENAGELNELEKYYRKLGKHSDAATIEYKMNLEIFKTGSLKQKLDTLKSFKRPLGSLEPLIEKQIELVNFLSMIQSMCPDKANELRKIESVADAISFCLTNSNLLKSNSKFTFEGIKNYFKMSDKQFAIYFIKTMAETKQYTEIEKFINNRNMFPKKIVSWELVCDLIHAAKGSPNELKKYLTQIEKEDSRFECAKKYKCHDIVIDILKSRKDKDTLSRYAYLIPSNSPDSAKAAQVLNELNRK